MSISQNDFSKIWASTSSVPEYTFSDADYQNGWKFVGELPPTRAMWDTLQRTNDEKMQFLLGKTDAKATWVDNVATLRSTDAEIGKVYATKGYYTANDGGNALYIIRGYNSQEQIDNSTSYEKQISVGKNYAHIMDIGGKTIVWNQLVDTGTASVTPVSGHKYYTFINGTASIITSDGTAISVADDSADMVCDLTRMFGNGNEPSTTSEFISIFPATHYSYDAGSLLSAGVSQIDSVGTNLCDGVAYLGLVDNNKLRLENFTPITSPYTTVANFRFAAFTFPVKKGETYYFESDVVGNPTTFSYAIYPRIEDMLYPSRTLQSGSATNNTFTANYSGVAMLCKWVTTGTTITWTYAQANKGSTAIAYTPYKHYTIPIPASIQALSGYGWSCPSHYNYIDFENKKYVQEVGSRTYASGDETDNTVITDGTNTYYALSTTVETDISAYLTADNTIEVEAGGTLTFVNSNGSDYQIPIPSKELFSNAKLINGATIFLNNGNLADVILNGVVYPEQFGTKGDGVSDDSTALNNAITYARSKKAKLYVSKTHYVGSSLTCDSYVHIAGANNAGFKTNEDINILNIVDNSTGVIVEDIGLTLPDRTTGTGIYMGYSRWTHINNVSISKGKYGIYCNGTYYCSFDNCGVFVGDVGISLNNCGAISFYDVHLNQNNTNLYCNASSSVSISGSCLEHPITTAQIVCDKGDLSISDTYIGDNNGFPSLIQNNGIVHIVNPTQQLYGITLNDGCLYISGLRIIYAGYGMQIIHNGGYLLLDNLNFCVAWLDIVSSALNKLSLPTRHTYSPAGNFKDLSSLIVDPAVTVVGKYSNQMGGTAIIAYNTSGAAKVKIPYEIPSELVNTVMVVKVRTKLPLNYYFEQGMWLYADETDSNDYDIERALNIAPIQGQYNYVSWAHAYAFGGIPGGDGSVCYFSVKVKNASGFLEFNFGSNADASSALCVLEYVELVTPVDAFCIARYE